VKRNGLTLFEVLIALALFATAIAAIAQLMSNGMQAGEASRRRAAALIRCESKLAELLSGVRPVETTRWQPLADNPRWSWSCNVSAERNSLRRIHIEVRHVSGASCTLTHLVRPPAVRRGV